MRIVDAAARLRDALGGVALEVAHVYHPLSYAWAPHEAYLRRHGAAPGRVILVGMNPGPWGMAQTGVPFADPAWARWMGIEAPVGRAAGEHPARPVRGFASVRADPSGAKLYGWARARFGTADAFFARCFVTNWCPLVLMDEAGRNVAPEKLRRMDRSLVEPPCDAWLADALDALQPAAIVALGAFVHDRLEAIRDERGLPAPLDLARHPSPANPANNAGWGQEIDALL